MATQVGTKVNSVAGSHPTNTSVSSDSAAAGTTRQVPIQYGSNTPNPTSTPTPSPSPTSGNGSTSQGGAPAGSPDAAYSRSTSILAPAQAPTEDDFFSKVHSEISPVLDSITQAEAAAESAAYAAGTKESTDLNASLGNRGLGGSSDAARLGATVNLDTAAAIAQAKKDQSTALSSAYQYLTGQAHTEFTDAQTRNDTLAKDYVSNMKSNALSTVKGLAESGITSADDLQKKSPQAYSALLQYYDNDTTALNSALVMNQPVANVKQTWTNGSTYYQLVTDPITGQPKVQSLDTGINIPVSWTPNKVSTTTLMMQDPSNPGNSIIYTTDPITGQPSVTGTGTGVAIADEYNKSHSSSSSSTSDSSATGTAGVNVAAALGTDPSTSMSTAVSTYGIGSVVAAIIKNEGGSPSGVVNNPGNVKYAGLPGQTDSGVKATDGGTFASYATPEAGQKAIADNVNQMVKPEDTIQSFMNRYAGQTGDSTSLGSNGLPTQEYGLLSNVAGFDPSKPGVDQAAANYLNQYLTQGKVPTAASVGISTRTGSGAAFNAIAQRADDVYFKATGEHLPDATTLASNKKLLAGNNSILNTLNLQEGTISANADLLLNNLDANNINQAAPLINNIIDSIKNSLGDPDVAQYLAQDATISNELGSLLALKNATGTTVHDKLEAAGIIDKGDSAAQIASKVKVLMQEAENGRNAIGKASGKLYMQTDPAGLNPQNPLNSPDKFAQSVGLDLNSIRADYPNMSDSEIVEAYINS